MVTTSRGVIAMNLKAFRLNDGLLYAMSSAIYALESVTYIKNKRQPYNYSISFLTRLGQVQFFSDSVIVDKTFTLVFSNGSTSGLSLVFDYECSKRKVFVWL
jgi:hypothetical protein